MTKEERLKLLKQIEKDIHVCSLESTLLDDAKSCAIHSVIEELEKEPCEDAVSRKAVITIIQNHWWNCRDIDKLVNELPSVAPLPIRIHAKWVQLDNEPDTFFTTHKYGCSNCGKIQLAKSRNIKKFRYCSKCGADMREVKA